MELQEDAIIDISPAREKFFGCSGKMLLPSRATIEAMLNRIPDHELITTDLLQKELAAQFEVEVTCPVTTQKALKAIARDATRRVAYWRVLKKNGELLSIFPGGVEAQAALLEKDGFSVSTNGKKPKVIDFKNSLVRLD